MTKIAFLTGATGFVGTHLARQLRRQDWRVIALVRPTAGRRDLHGLGLEFREGDITDPQSLDDAVPDGVDALFHVAASTSIWSRERALQERINVAGTENIIRAALKRGVRRLVHTSSFVVWGFHDATIDETTPWTDGDPADPARPGDNWINYLRTKRLAERAVKTAVAERGLDAVICNPAHILGPGDRHNWSRMIRMVNEGSLPGIPPGGGAFADVRAVAAAHIAAWHRGERGANYLLGGEDISFLDLVRRIGVALGRPVPARTSPAWQLALAGRIASWRAAFTGKAPSITPEGAAMISRHIHCDSKRAVDALGYRFTPIDALLADTIRWMREEKLLQ